MLDRSDQVFDMAGEYGAHLSVLRMTLSCGQLRRLLVANLDAETKEAYVRRIRQRMRLCDRLPPYGAFSEEDLALMRVMVSSVCGIDPNDSRSWECHSRQETLCCSLPREALEERLCAAVSENPVLLWLSKSGELPITVQDITGKGGPARPGELTAEQRAYITGYRNIERLRGFHEPEEVPCRVSLFYVQAHSCVLVVTFGGGLLSPAMERRFMRRLTDVDVLDAS